MKRILIPALALVGILASGCLIQSYALFKDDAGQTHFVGLASNLTNADVADSVVEIKYFDSSNNLLATQWASPCTRTLQDHSSSPVEAVIPAGVTADRVETVVHWQTVGTKAVPDLDVTNVEFAVDGTTSHLTGDVENNDNQRLRAIQVCAAFFNDDDEIVRAGRVYLDPPTLEDRAEGSFDIAVEDMPADVEQYQLWVDATTRSPTDVTGAVVVGPDSLEDVVTATGWLEPSAQAADVGGGFETTPAEAFTDDGDSAVSTDTADGESHRYYNYDIADELPDDVEIDGIEVRLDWFLDAVDGVNTVDIELSWDAGTTWTAVQTVTADPEPIAEDTDILGGEADNWGHTWDIDDDELADANFRVRVTFQTDVAVRDFSLEWIPVRVHYSPS